MTTPLLSIVTLTVPGRERTLHRLQTEVRRQIEATNTGGTVQHFCLPNLDNHPLEPYGSKMRRATEIADGTYICFVDDDDYIHPNYLTMILDKLTHNPDVVTFNIAQSHPKHTPIMEMQANWAWNRRGPRGQSRIPANHFAVWKRWLALSAPWFPCWYGCEVVWTCCMNYGFTYLKAEHIPEALYIHDHNSASTVCQSRDNIACSMMMYGEHGEVHLFRDNAEPLGTNLLCATAFPQRTGVVDRYWILHCDGSMRWRNANELEHLYTVEIK